MWLHKDNSMKIQVKLYSAFLFTLITLTLAGSATASQQLAGSVADSQVQEQAMLLHNRIAGMPPNKATLDKMVALLKAGKKQEAAAIATNSAAFYSVTLRDMFSAWSNTLGKVDVDLNDMVATMIGMVRDDVPFNEVLSGDYLYTGDDRLGKYNPADNSLYVELQKQNLQQALVKRKQSEVFEKLKYLPDEAQAGVISTRAFGRAYFTAGTNRRATAFTLKHFLCHDMEALHDPTITDDKVRRDVSRAPGGDANLFNNRCKGCHSGMDALSGWSVYYDFLNQKTVYEQVVSKKITKNNYIFPNGHQPVDDSFVNLWTSGQNSSLGWGSTTNGNGAKDYGKMLTASDAFASCMATHTYKQVCLFIPETKKEKTLRDELAEDFKSNDYSMRKLFAATAAACLLGED